MRRAQLRLFLQKQPGGKEILSNDKLFDQLDDALARESKGRPFLKFLFENRKEIIELIKLLLK